MAEFRVEIAPPLERLQPLQAVGHLVHRNGIVAPAFRPQQGEIEARYRGIQWLDLEHDCHGNGQEPEALRELPMTCWLPGPDRALRTARLGQS